MAARTSPEGSPGGLGGPPEGPPRAVSGGRDEGPWPPAGRQGGWPPGGQAAEPAVDPAVDPAVGRTSGPPDPARLKTALIGAFRARKGILASGLEKSLPWEWTGEKLVIPVRDTLGAELLKKDAAFIREALADTEGRPLAFEVVIREDSSPEPPPEEKEDLSPQAEMVLRLFRGTVVKTK
jgi:hypothetical protein